MIDAPSYIHESLAGLSVPIDSLNLDAANVRTHDDRNLDAIARSLDRWGQRQPIVVQREGMIVRAGNGRLLAAKRLGWTHMAALVVDEDSVEATAYAIADNRTGELAGWDEEGLVAMLQSMPDDLPDIGFTDGDLEQLIRDLTPDAQLENDPVPALPENPATNPGDLWTLGPHRVLCGDSTSEPDVSRLLAGACPRLMVTDPPYGVEYDPMWREVISHADGRRGGKVSNDDRANWSEAWTLWRPDVIYAWSAAGDNQFDAAEGIRSAGYEIRNQIIWAKPHFPISRGHYTYRHEPCWYAVRKGARSGWIGDKSQSTLWDISLDKNVEGGHGTQKPVECMARPIRNHEGDVADPFLGSGTTLIAADQLGRTCYGMEISPAYCDVIVRRWEALTGSRAARVDSEGNEAGPMPEPQEAAVAAGG
jgi:DNA modification methylase